MHTLVMALTVFGASIVIAACGGGDDEPAPAQQTPNNPAPPSTPPPPPPPPPPAGNQAPTIGGTPPTSVVPGTQYSFTPTATDGDQDVLTFSIVNKPSWATFTTSNGRLRGTPSQADVGTYENIQISVTDGEATANLPAFGITVVATATGSATLSWTPPTQNTDGSPLTNLAGYRVYWGTSQGNLSNSTQIGANVTSYLVESLTPATWYFALSAVNSQGLESGLSNVVSKTIQ